MATIPLSFQNPVIESPLDAQRKALSLQQLGQTTQMNAVRLQQAQLQAKQMQQDQADAQTIQREYANAVQNIQPGKKLDMNALRQSIASKVGPRTLQAFDKSTQEHAAAMAKLTQDEINTRKEQYGLLANHLGAVAQVKPGDNSPEAIQARAAEWAKQVTLAKSKGLDPDNQLTTDYPGDEALPVYDVQLRGAQAHLATEEALRKAKSEEFAQTQAEATAPAKRTKAQADADKAAADALQAQVSSAAGELSQPMTAANYLLKKSTLPAAVAAKMPDVPDGLDPNAVLPDDFRTQVLTSGMTPKDRATLSENQFRNSAQVQYWKDLAAAAKAREARMQGESSAQNNLNRRLWSREVTDLEKEERNTNMLRQNLEAALANRGKTYVDEKGKTMSMNTATKDTNEAADALVASMRARYEALTNNVKGIVSKKNGLAGELGVQVRVPTDTVHAALDADIARVKGYKSDAEIEAEKNKPKPTAPTPTAAPPQAPSSSVRGAAAPVTAQTPFPLPPDKASKPQVNVGSRVKLRSGAVVTVTEVHGDGTFDYE